MEVWKKLPEKKATRSKKRNGKNERKCDKGQQGKPPRAGLWTTSRLRSASPGWSSFFQTLIDITQFFKHSLKLHNFQNINWNFNNFSVFLREMWWNLNFSPIPQLLLQSLHGPQADTLQFRGSVENIFLKIKSTIFSVFGLLSYQATLSSSLGLGWHSLTLLKHFCCCC